MSSTEASLAPFLMEVGIKTHLGFISLNLLLQSALKKNKKQQDIFSLQAQQDNLCTFKAKTSSWKQFSPLCIQTDLRQAKTLYV